MMHSHMNAGSNSARAVLAWCNEAIRRARERPVVAAWAAQSVAGPRMVATEGPCAPKADSWGGDFRAEAQEGCEEEGNEEEGCEEAQVVQIEIIPDLARPEGGLVGG